MRDDQDGVILADSVGMGKTWEALSATALLLYRRGYEKGQRKVLVVCPANLITKWEDELAHGSRFRERLHTWVRQRQGHGSRAKARVVEGTLSQVYPITRGSHVRLRQKYGKFKPSGGTYIVSHNLVAGGRARSRGLAALRRCEWDVIIVDEAHHSMARTALQRLSAVGRPHTKLLLTATPFELNPGQVHKMTGLVLKHGHKLLAKPEVRPYLEAMERFFASPEADSPSIRFVRDASALIRRLVARTVARSSNRSYAVLLRDGTVLDMPARLDQLDAVAVEQLLRGARRVKPRGTKLFERRYLQARLALVRAGQSHRQMTSLRLRRYLAKSEGAATPRLAALQCYLSCALERDMRAALSDGLPRKTIVFTSLVGGGRGGEAEAIRETAARAYASALASMRQRYSAQWTIWLRRGRQLIYRACSDYESPWEHDELTAALAGANKRFWRRACSRRRAAYARWREAQEAARRTDADRHSVEFRASQRRLHDAETALASWEADPPFQPVERYTGNERRTERNRVATAFREMGQPWVLVASNVGAEGIDLQTFTRRIIHYDLEWNPAKMEQREGRGDRLGRLLKEGMNVVYCLVPDTYDERMFTQLIARDRWHGVLLGKPALKLSREESQVRLEQAGKLEQLALDLRPRPR